MNELGRYPLLTAAQEVELAKRIERGDESAKEQMINSNLRLVVHIARRYVGHSVPLGDLIQEGVIGLNRAAEKFDWRKGFKFSTYATWWIRQACQRAVANQSKTIRIPVHVDERRNKLRRARQQFEIKHGREPSVEELAETGGMSVQHAQEALEAVEASVSLNTRLGDGDAELGDLFADRESIDPELAADDSLRGLAVRRALEKLPERERRVIEMRFGFHGETNSLEAIGRGARDHAGARPAARGGGVRAPRRRARERGRGRQRPGRLGVMQSGARPPCGRDPTTRLGIGLLLLLASVDDSTTFSERRAATEQFSCSHVVPSSFTISVGHRSGGNVAAWMPNVPVSSSPPSAHASSVRSPSARPSRAAREEADRGRSGQR